MNHIFKMWMLATLLQLKLIYQKMQRYGHPLQTVKKNKKRFSMFLLLIQKSFESVLANIFFMLDKYIEFHFQNCDREVMSIEHEIRTMIVLEFASQFIIGVAKELWTKR